MTTLALNVEGFRPRRILLTGATGYVGSLILTSLLGESDAEIIVLARENHTKESLLEPVEVEFEANGRAFDASIRSRVQLLPIPATFPALQPLAREAVCEDIDEIIHCAGSVDYFNREQLELVNVEFTKGLLDLAREIGIGRFVYISTAYSSGYRDRVALEGLHDSSCSDPTDYTRTKREAEHHVAASGLPFVILRPSILIGHSVTGRYSGKRYGLYQQWMGLERLICTRYHDEFHTVAPRMPLNLIHQDAFQAAFVLAHRHLPDGAIMHIVSSAETAPSMRDLWDMWLEVMRPRSVYYYPTLDDVPLQRIHMRQRAYLTFAQVNLEIAAHRWQFEGGWLERLRDIGLSFEHVSCASVRRCQDRFIRSSTVMQEYLHKHAALLAKQIDYIDIEGAALAANAN